MPKHDDERVDNWYWLREKDNPVVAHLESENSYTQACMAETQTLQQHLYEEIVSRIQETDLSVPVRKGDWRYYSRTEEGKQYAIHCRVLHANEPVTETDASEQILFDENDEAGEHDFFSLGAFAVSPDGSRLAYNVDTSGDEVFTMRVRDLTTGADLADVIERTHYGAAWSKDGTTLFYTRPDDNWRPFQVWRHRVGTPAEQDELMYQDDDARYYVSVAASKTDEYVVITTSSSLTSEVRVLRATDADGSFQLIEPRREGVEYHVFHHHDAEGERFFILTNEDAPNFKLMVTSTDDMGREHWQEVVGHRTEVKVDDVEPFVDYLVLSERADANARLSILDLRSGSRQVIDQPEDVYTAHTAGNAEFESTTLRYEYTSLVTPRTVYDFDLVTGERTLRKQQPVLGGYDASLYTSRREWAMAEDGTRIPISVVYRSEGDESERYARPALLYGYGAYEISIDPMFSSLRLSLLDRGFAFAIAHVRGGGDMGRLWYEHGKLFEKKNTFTDFIACARHLIDTGYTTPEQLIIRGGSAGGLLIGAVVNMQPSLFAAAVAEVPFVDILTTMLDPSLPLTVHEYEEWGNPEEPSVYEYMKSYSPYDNTGARAYPELLVTAGFNDPRVSYWEPVKWVQKLRDEKSDNNDILLKVEMGAGHMGPSGRYDAWRDEAFVYAFMLRALGLAGE